LFHAKINIIGELIMDDYIMSFEEYCIDVLDIPYYNFLSKKEWEECYEKYEHYLERLPDDE
jgi:hypothetical protein